MSRNVDLGDDVAGIVQRAVGAGQHRIEQRNVHCIGQEEIAPVRRAGCGMRRRLIEPIALQPPQEDADVHDVVAAAAERHGTDIGGARGGIEGTADQLQVRRVAQVVGARIVEAHMVGVLRPAEPREIFHRMRRPARRVARHRLEHRHGALAAAVLQRVGDVGAGAVAAVGAERLQAAHADQIADIRHHPFVAGLDEQVLVHLRDIRFEHRTLFRQDRDHRLELVALLRVAQA